MCFAALIRARISNMKAKEIWKRSKPKSIITVATKKKTSVTAMNGLHHSLFEFAILDACIFFSEMLASSYWQMVQKFSEIPVDSGETSVIPRKILPFSRKTKFTGMNRTIWIHTGITNFCHAVGKRWHFHFPFHPPASDFAFKHHPLSYERQHADLCCLAI